MKRLASFAVAGGAGFATDAGILFVLTALAGFGPMLSRLVSICAAILVTWAINRRHTFGPSGRTLAAEGARYGAVAVAIAAFNYLVYAGLLLLLPALWPVAALMVSSAAAMALSFLGYSRLVFSPTR